MTVYFYITIIIRSQLYLVKFKSNFIAVIWFGHLKKCIFLKIIFIYHLPPDIGPTLLPNISPNI